MDYTLCAMSNVKRQALLFVIMGGTFFAACDGDADKFNGGTNELDGECEYLDKFSNGSVCVSEDGCVIIESGVSMDSYTNYGHWAKWTITDEKGEKHKLRYENFSFVSGVHDIHKKDGSVFYIVVCSEATSSWGSRDWVEAYKIAGDTIMQVSVADGGEMGDDNSEFSVQYAVADWYDATGGVGYDWIFEYDAAKRNLYVPVTDGDMIILDRYEVWHFNGEKFVSLGKKPHRDLYGNLSEYNRLICYFTTKDYIVRIDSLDSNELRYASWKKPKNMADKPDIVIKGGLRHQCPAPTDESQSHDEYCFKMGDDEYIINYFHDKEIGDSLIEHYYLMLVRKDGKLILKQKG